MRRCIVISVFGALMLVLASCVGPESVATAGFSAAQAGIFEYKKGTLRTAWEAPPEMMFEASKQVLVSLGYRITRVVNTGREWKVRAMEIDDTAIDIELERASSVVTVLSIRVGTWGDQPVSKLILDRIDRHVKEWEDSAGKPVPPRERRTGA